MKRLSLAASALICLLLVSCEPAPQNRAESGISQSENLQSDTGTTLKAQEDFEYHTYDDPFEGRFDLIIIQADDAGPFSFLGWLCKPQDNLEFFLGGSSDSDSVALRFDAGEILGAYETVTPEPAFAGLDSAIVDSIPVQVRFFRSTLEGASSARLADLAANSTEVSVRYYRSPSDSNPAGYNRTTVFDLTGSKQALDRLSCR